VLAEAFAALVRNACRGVMQRSVHAILMARNFVVILTSCSHQQIDTFT